MNDTKKTLFLSLSLILPVSAAWAEPWATTAAPLLGVKFQAAKKALEVVLSVPGPVKAGEVVPLSVRVKNAGKGAVMAVRSLDGSWWGRKPGYTLSVTGPDGKPVQLPMVRGCGNVNRLGKGDFEALTAGAEFDPFKSAFGNPQLELWKPAVPGKYRVKITVDYDSADPTNSKDWNGAINGPVKDPVLLGLLQQVPKDKYEAELEIEVR